MVAAAAAGEASAGGGVAAVAGGCAGAAVVAGAAGAVAADGVVAVAAGGAAVLSVSAAGGAVDAAGAADGAAGVCTFATESAGFVSGAACVVAGAAGVCGLASEADDARGASAQLGLSGSAPVVATGAAAPDDVCAPTFEALAIKATTAIVAETRDKTVVSINLAPSKRYAARWRFPLRTCGSFLKCVHSMAISCSWPTENNEHVGYSNGVPRKPHQRRSRHH